MITYLLFFCCCCCCCLALLPSADMSEIKARIQGIVRTLINFADLKEPGKSRQEYVVLLVVGRIRLCSLSASLNSRFLVIAVVVVDMLSSLPMTFVSITDTLNFLLPSF